VARADPLAEGGPDMKLVLINLPTPFLENPKWVYPLGLLHVATWARDVLHHDVEILDLADATDEDFEARVRAVEADAVGVSAVTPQAEYLAKVPQLCPDPFLLAGGIHPSLFPHHALMDGYDVVVKGEAEGLLEEALTTAPSGSILTAKDRLGLEETPRPARSLFSGYSGPVPMMAGRGCPFACAFCAQTDRRVRFRDPKAVVEELKALPNRDAIFYDDTFTMKMSWLYDFAMCIKDLGVFKRLRCSTRADRMTDRTATLLLQSGFVEVCLGVESGDQDILDGIQKLTSVEDNTKAVEVCRRSGLAVKAFIMLGLPGESEESIKRTYDWIVQAQPDKLGLYMFNPLPGSPIYHHPEKYDLRFLRGGWNSRYYGGDRNKMTAQVCTSKISADRITDWYRIFLRDFAGLL
jgi:anaerobic magnesium-protoporphyrin IX monomethyl ester cyclase